MLFTSIYEQIKVKIAEQIFYGKYNKHQYFHLELKNTILLLTYLFCFLLWTLNYSKRFMNLINRKKYFAYRSFRSLQYKLRATAEINIYIKLSSQTCLFMEEVLFTLIEYGIIMCIIYDSFVTYSSKHYRHLMWNYLSIL